MPSPMPTDPEVLAYIARTDAFYPPDAVEGTMAERRARYDAYCRAMLAPLPGNVAFADFAIPATGPARAIPARRYTPDPLAAGGPTVMYLHGGGYVVGGLESHHDICAELSARTRLALVAVDYRLAPEHVHPAHVEDAEAAYRHLASVGSKVIVGGDSAGAGLAAALCLRCKAKGLPMPSGQFLVYGGFGGDATKGSYVDNSDAPHLTTRDTLDYFALRTGGLERAGVRDVDLRPLLAPDFSRLPPAAIVSADLDPLRDDSRDLAGKLAAAGVAVAYRNEPQLVHAYLRARHISRRAGESFAFIARAISAMAAGTFPQGLA